MYNRRERPRGRWRERRRGGWHANNTFNRYQDNYRRFNSKTLEDVISLPTEEKFLIAASAFRDNLKKLLAADDKSKNKLLLECFDRVSRSQRNETCSSLMALLRDSNFLTSSVDDSFNDWEETMSESDFGQLAENFVRICKLFFQLFPASYKNVRPGILKLISRKVDKELADQASELLKIRKELEERNEQPKQKRRKVDDKNLPPDDYRQISLYPQPKEIHSPDPPFLRKNRTFGSYDSAEQYLDVQFRLLRADLLIPLKEGLQEILSNVKSYKRKERLRVYQGVKFERIQAERNGVEYVVSFKLRRPISATVWQHNKKLVFGSLLCISKDGFQTMQFATVAGRNPADLEKGFLSVRFEDDESGEEYIRNTTAPLQMVESSTFFPAYKDVLRYLQECKTVPMERYLVKCVKDVRPPAYLRGRDTIPVYNLRKIIDLPEGVYEDGVRILEQRSWPTHEETIFNESQLESFKSVLTKEFAIVQGPPGTGKTFVGLKIAHALLENKDYWIERTEEVWNEREEKESHVTKRAPMLVVCYTNHALDQFVHGLLDQGHTNILRVGGRGDDSLENCTARHMFRKIDPAELKDVCKSLYNSYQERDAILHKLKEREVFLERDIDFSKQLMPLMDLSVVMKETFYWAIFDIRSAFKRFGRSNNESITKLHLFLGLVGDLPHQRSNRRDVRKWLNDGYTFVQPSSRKMAYRIKQRYKSSKPLNKTTRESIKDPWDLSFADRWNLYRYWCEELKKNKEEKVKADLEKYKTVVKQIEEMQELKLQIAMDHADVIAMTSTCAAMKRVALGYLQPRIVIIEEAAEVLEAHVLASLNPGVEHLILIGDHKQLRPNPATYELARKYQLDISLFERMLNNKIRYNTLDVQHRMAPHISHLMRHQYPALVDHPDVKAYPIIRGVSHNMTFVGHSMMEVHVEDSHSKLNDHEASFVAAFARYLVQQGYDVSKITILTFYMGQVIAIKKQLALLDLEGMIRVSAIDNYQGEENDIILVSLVRSNEEMCVGFVANENRITVALSRAKHGMYVIGNLEMIREKSTYWDTVIKDVEEVGSYTDCLTLHCQRHPKISIQAFTATDFLKAPEGGCQQKCNYRLPCGHVCPRYCHPSDPDHVEEKCKKICGKVTCGFNHHLCQSECHYGEECGPCKVLVNKGRESCGHKVRLACWRDEESVKCTIRVIEDLPCHHKGRFECYVPYNEMVCNKRCKATLSCGHACTGTCGACYGGRVHIRCTQKCDRVLVCSHVCKEPCAQDCPPCKQKCKNACVHSKCPKKCCEPCTKCIEPCERGCKHRRCKKTCNEMCEIEPCLESCDQVLGCGHPCIGLCGEPCPNKCKVCNKAEVEEIFFGTEDEPNSRFVQLPDCGHVFEVSGLDEWFKVENESGDAIKMKDCPRCRTVVRTCERYGNRIKASLADIEQVKAKIYDGAKKIVKSEFGVLLEKIKPHFFSVHLKYLAKFETFSLSSLFHLNFIEHKRPELRHLRHLDLCYAARYVEDTQLNKILQQTNFNFRQLDQVEIEIQRCLLLKRIRKMRRDKSQVKTEETALELTSLKRKSFGIFSTKDAIEKLKEEFGLLRKKYSMTEGLNDDEKVMVREAIGLGKGHWYKCENGHIYAIGECGGAMERSKCPECASVIGGSNHSLAQGNEHAGDFDDSTHAAWGEMANNPRNWDQEQLRQWQM